MITTWALCMITTWALCMITTWAVYDNHMSSVYNHMSSVYNQALNCMVHVWTFPPLSVYEPFCILSIKSVLKMFQHFAHNISLLYFVPRAAQCISVLLITAVSLLQWHKLAHFWNSIFLPFEPNSHVDIWHCHTVYTTAVNSWNRSSHSHWSCSSLVKTPGGLGTKLEL